MTTGVSVPWYIQALGVSATVTTVACFFMGVPICVEIYKRKSTKDISRFPFLISLVSITFWLRYGMIKQDLVMTLTNSIGIVLFACYNAYYLHYTRDKGWLVIQLGVCVVVNYSMLVLVAVLIDPFYKAVEDSLGFCCTVVQVVTFGAPLAGVFTVFKKRSCDTLPLPLIASFALVSFQWMLYGVAKNDIYMIIANGLGLLLGLFQLSLFLVFPLRDGWTAPLARCFSCVANLANNNDEVEEV